MDVHVDPAGEHEPAASIDLPDTAHRPTELHDDAVAHTHVGVRRAGRGDDRAAADDEVEAFAGVRCHDDRSGSTHRQPSSRVMVVRTRET